MICFSVVLGVVVVFLSGLEGGGSWGWRGCFSVVLGVMVFLSGLWGGGGVS